MKGVSVMASVPRAESAPTLEAFLARPNIDEKPYLEFIDGRVEAKMSPQQRHGLLQIELGGALNAYARPRRLGLAFVELRCSYAGRSILPDVAFVTREHVIVDAEGEISTDLFLGAPDLHVEIVSPDQAIAEQRERLLHSTAHGAALGWLIDPYRKRVEVVRPGGAVVTLDEDGVLAGEPVLPGFALPVAEVWGWLRPGP
jgi:Uma2 family endonuclease